MFDAARRSLGGNVLGINFNVKKLITWTRMMENRGNKIINLTTVAALRNTIFQKYKECEMKKRRK